MLYDKTQDKINNIVVTKDLNNFELKEFFDENQILKNKYVFLIFIEVARIIENYSGRHFIKKIELDHASDFLVTLDKECYNCFNYQNER